MHKALERPILGLDNEIPDSLYLLHHVSTGKYGCYCHDGVHGLACFSTEDAAVRFSEFIDLTGIETLSVSFDEAREVAKQRPLPVVSLMLLDRIGEPKIHYVR